LNTKKGIVKRIADQTDLSQAQAREIVQMTLDSIIDALAREGRIELRNFGVFEVKKRPARHGRNFKTGDRMDVPEKLVVNFKAGKEMEAQVQRLDAKPMSELIREGIAREKAGKNADKPV